MIPSYPTLRPRFAKGYHNLPLVSRFCLLRCRSVFPLLAPLQNGYSFLPVPFSRLSSAACWLRVGFIVFLVSVFALPFLFLTVFLRALLVPVEFGLTSSSSSVGFLSFFLSFLLPSFLPCFLPSFLSVFRPCFLSSFLSFFLSFFISFFLSFLFLYPWFFVRLCCVCASLCMCVCVLVCEFVCKEQLPTLDTLEVPGETSRSPAFDQGRLQPRGSILSRIKPWV